MRDERNLSLTKASLKDKLTAIILIETSKDYKEMDSDLVKDCVDFLMELEGKEKLTKKEIDRRVKEIPFKGKVIELGSYAKKKIMAKKLALFAAVLAVLMMLFGLFAVASGNTADEFFRLIGRNILEMSDGSSMEYNNVTFVKAGKTEKYTSVEAIVKSENVEILYPSRLPDNEKITEVWYVKEDNSERYVMYCDDSVHSIDVDMGADLSEKTKSNCITKEIAGHTVYCFNDTQWVQAIFTYENNLYLITSDTEDNLFRIIENLKEIE